MSEAHSSNNARIAKNTLYLYIRTFITMAVSLYTSRVVLAALGIEDFGIWSVVGGVVAMFLFIKDSLSTSVGRFLTFAIGKNDQHEINKAFSISIFIHLIFALLIVIVCESIGLWFLGQKLVIPEEKRWIADWVFHISVISTFVSIASVPFHSSLISYERMNVYAYMGLWDAFSKLIIAYVVTIVDENRLIVYGILILCCSILSTSVVIWYVHHSFPKMRYYMVRDRQMYKEIFSFSGWSIFGNLAFMTYTQGLNMVLNMFFGPVVNAARAVSLQVEQSVRTFVTNFQVAANPQIIKNCASENWAAMHLLMFRISKFSVYLLYIFALPIVLEIDSILAIWLKDVPEHSAVFCRIMFCVIMLNTMANPIMIGVSANGEIKKYQLVVSSILLLILPVSYVCLSLGMGPASVFVVYFLFEFLACIARALIAREKIHFPIRQYIKQVVIIVGITMLMGALVPVAIRFTMADSLLRLALVLCAGFITSCLSIYFLGMNTNERRFVYEKIVGKVLCKF